MSMKSLFAAATMIASAMRPPSPSSTANAAPRITAAELATLLAGMQPTSGRIGVEVYRDRLGRKAKREVTVTSTVVCEYDLRPSRRLRRTWQRY